MPIYEYRCANGHSFEVFQPMSEDPVGVCTECGAVAQRVLSAPAVHFKGSGFYTTDYAKKKSGGGEKAKESKSDGKAGSGSPGSGEKPSKAKSSSSE